MTENQFLPSDSQRYHKLVRLTVCVVVDHYTASDESKNEFHTFI